MQKIEFEFAFIVEFTAYDIQGQFFWKQSRNFNDGFKTKTQSTIKFEL